MSKQDIQKELQEIIILTRNYIKQEGENIDFYPLDKSEQLRNLEQRFANCQLCPLAKTRIKFVFGAGNPEAKLIFVGEAPGYQEDRKGMPFVGRAGELLTKIIESINLKREDVYITNVVKCHPLRDPSNIELKNNDRPPNENEITLCLPILQQQIKIIQPKIICTLGATATCALLGTKLALGNLRNKVHFYEGIKLIPTYHPAALLRFPQYKKETWQDMKKIRDLLKECM